MIGLETHITVTNTTTKIFCSCLNQEGAEPNTHICPVCTGEKGSIPVLNSEVIQEAIKLAKAFHSEIPDQISFDRKHYDYIDLPKGFPITQYERPIAKGGIVHCHRKNGEPFSVQLDHFHLEEDPAKLTHLGTTTLIDFNRSGKPLLEIVTRPEIHSIEDALTYMEYLQQIVRSLGISDADMEKGHFKSDISISLRKKGDTKLNPRTEIKNMNSFKFSQEALITEISNQLSYRTQHGKFKTDQLTMGRNETTQSLDVLREKENVADYKVIPEPNIPLTDIVKMKKQATIDEEVLPFVIEEKLLAQTSLSLKDIQFFSQEPKRARLLFEANEAVQDLPFLVKIAMNNLPAEVYDQPVAEFLPLIQELHENARLPLDVFQTLLFEKIKKSDYDRKSYLGDLVLSDKEAKELTDKVLSDPKHAGLVEDLRNGEKKAMSLLVREILQSTPKRIAGKYLETLIGSAILHVVAPVNKKASRSAVRSQQKNSPSTKYA